MHIHIVNNVIFKNVSPVDYLPASKVARVIKEGVGKLGRKLRERFATHDKRITQLITHTHTDRVVCAHTYNKTNLIPNAMLVLARAIPSTISP